MKKFPIFNPFLSDKNFFLLFCQRQHCSESDLKTMLKKQCSKKKFDVYYKESQPSWFPAGYVINIILML